MRREEAESVERAPLTQKAVQKFCLNFAETSLQAMNSGARKEAEDVIQTTFDANFLTQRSFVDT